MNIPGLAIRNHVFTWMLMAGLLIFGGIAFDRMGVSQLPDVDFPIVNISASLDGASPEVIEADLLDPIESGLTSVQGIKSISSTARTGGGSVTVEFGLEKDIDTAVQEIQSALGRVQRQLPTGVEPPTVSKSNPESQPILWLGASSTKYSQTELMTLVRDRVRDQFSTVSGVGEVTLGGYLEPNLRVWLIPEKLRAYQLTAADVISAIQREHSEKPGGRIETSEREINIRTLGEAPSVEDFGNITIGRRGGAVNFVPIALKDVARIEEGTEDVRSMSRADGKAAVSLGIRKQPGANAVRVASEVKERMREVSAQLPEGVNLDVRFDSTVFIEEAVDELNYTLLFSAILTAAVIWLFLGSWSATLNVILAIPTSVVGTFIVLYWLGFTLNTFTLLGLSLAIGIVVDDAIMVLENIVRHRQMGKGRVQSAHDGATEIMFAALAATLAIIAIFLPVAFMEGLIGKYFFQFGVTLSVAVAISLIEAITLTPMRSSRFLVVQPRVSWIGKTIERAFEKSADLYRRLIPVTLSHPFLTILFATVFFASTVLVGKILKKEFIPAQDQSRLMMRFQTPVGSSLAFTTEKFQHIEDYLRTQPEIKSFFGFVGGFGGGQVNTGMFFLNLKPPGEREKSAQELMGSIREGTKGITALKGIRIMLQDPSLSSFGSSRRGNPVEFTVRGPDWRQLVEASQKLVDAMEKSGVLTDVDTNYQAGMPEIQVIPNRVKARQRGVEVAEISQVISTAMAGAIAGKFSKGGRRFDVRVSLPAESRGSIDAIRKLGVRNNRGEMIPLSEVVEITEQPGLQGIFREDRQRAISVYGGVAPTSSQAEAIETVRRLAKEVLPEGYYAVPGGSAKQFEESFTSLIFALVLGILVSYMVLASQFNSFIHPITILIALPFSVSGAFIALWLGGQSLNIYSMIGLILLMGIVKKNSIMLVEFTNHVRDQGRPTREALIEACPVRLRPILMTSLATIAGAVPAALALGPGAESRIPMALAVIGGVLVSTLLTLFVVPSVYLILDRLRFNRMELSDAAAQTRLAAK